jgi:hypothetical protein
MKNNLNEFFRWSVYYTLNVLSGVWNFVSKLFGIESQADLGLSWLVFLESRRVEREIQERDSQRLNKQKEAEEKMRLAKEDLDSYGQDISQQQ